MAGRVLKKCIKSINTSKYLNGTATYSLKLFALTCTNNRNYSSGVQDDPNFWVKSPSPHIETVVGKTLPEFLWDRVGQYGTATAYECAVTGRKYNFQELQKYSRGFGAALIKSGAQRGEVIGLVLPNMPEYAMALLGSFDAGLVVSTINPGYTSFEIVRQLQNSETKYVVTVETFLPTILKAKESCPLLTKIVVIGSSVPEGCLSFFEMMKTDPTGIPFLKGVEIDTTKTTAMLPYSSGTTGPPKGVELTHSGLATNVLQHAQPDVGSAQSGQERFLGVLPFYHVAGFQWFTLYGVYQGANIFCLPKFDPASFVQALRKQRPTNIHLVPPLVSFICQSPDIGPPELKSVHSIVAGAAPLGDVLIKKTLDKAGKYIHFQEAYGMTEMSGVIQIVNPSLKNTKIGSAGTPLPNTMCKVIDVETGRSLGSNQRGELCIKGPQMMKGYLKNEKATADTIDPQGWLHTGDICYYDEDKCFYIVDRLKELIKVKGYQVAPSELEDLLRSHENVADVAVIGIPDEAAGELPRAYVVPKNKKLVAEELNEFLRDKVTAYKQLKGGIEFIEAIPKAPSGKILRRELLADYKSKIAKI